MYKQISSHNDQKKSIKIYPLFKCKIKTLSLAVVVNALLAHGMISFALKIQNIISSVLFSKLCEKSPGVGIGFVPFITFSNNVSKYNLAFEMLV